MISDLDLRRKLLITSSRAEATVASHTLIYLTGAMARTERSYDGIILTYNITRVNVVYNHCLSNYRIDSLRVTYIYMWYMGGH